MKLSDLRWPMSWATISLYQLFVSFVQLQSTFNQHLLSFQGTNRMLPQFLSLINSSDSKWSLPRKVDKHKRKPSATWELVLVLKPGTLDFSSTQRSLTPNQQRSFKMKEKCSLVLDHSRKNPDRYKLTDSEGFVFSREKLSNGGGSFLEKMIDILFSISAFNNKEIGGLAEDKCFGWARRQRAISCINYLVWSYQIFTPGCWQVKFLNVLKMCRNQPIAVCLYTV